MTLSKPLFFGIVFVLVVTPFWVAKFLWVIHSQRARGVMAFKGMGLAGDQVKEDYSVICFRAGKDTIWFNGLGNIPFRDGDSIYVRYRPDNVYDARVDIFAGVWGDTLVYSGIPAAILLVLFVHARVVPWGSRVRLTVRKPFIQIWVE